MSVLDKLRKDFGQLTATDRQTILDSLNVRALDRQSDKYGEAGADAAADLYLLLTGCDPSEDATTA